MAIEGGKGMTGGARTTVPRLPTPTREAVDLAGGGQNRVVPDLIIFANAAGMGSTDPQMSGGDRIWIELSKRWAASGARVTLSCGRSGALMFSRYSSEKSGVCVDESGPSSHDGQSLWRTILYEVATVISGTIAIPRLSRNATTVYIASSDFIPDFLPALLSRFKGGDRTRLVATLWITAPNPFGPDTPYRGRRKLENLAIFVNQMVVRPLLERFSEMIWVTNDRDRQDLLDRTGLPAGRILSVMGGVDRNIHCPAPNPLAPVYDGVFVGRLHPQKGVLELIEIWKRVVRLRPKARLAIVGDGPLRREVTDRIRELGLSSSIMMLGFLDGSAKVTVLQSSKIFLHPVLRDSGGMASVEGMSCGLPVVCFDLPALESYLPRGAVKVPPYNLDLFAKKVVELAEDDVFRLRLADEAVQYATSWDWSKRATDCLNAIKDLISGP